MISTCRERPILSVQIKLPKEKFSQGKWDKMGQNGTKWDKKEEKGASAEQVQEHKREEDIAT